MTDEQPEQWARELWLTTFVCATATHPISDNAAALALQRAFAEREAELVGALRGVIKALEVRYPYGDPRASMVFGPAMRDADAAINSREAGHG